MLTELLPLAMVIALSPLSIIPAVLVLQSPRPRPAGLMFMLGWLLALTLLTALFVEISGLLGGLGKEPPAWASWLRIGVGAALIAFGVFRWITRNSKPHAMPGTQHLTTAGPGKAFVVGALLAVVNPKVLFICIAAGLAIGSSGREYGSGLAVAIEVFVILAGCTVALPVLAYAVSGRRLDPTLAKVKTWMEAHNAALVAVILIVIGIMVLYKGIHAL